MANKKTIIIGVFSALLIGGGVFWWMKSKKDKAEEEKRRQEEEAQKAEEEKRNNMQISNQLPSTPFTNSIEGNNFRAWVNNKYPTYAKQIDLSLSGDYNNSFIRKAFQKYGSEFIKEGKSAPKTATSSGFKVGNPVYLKTDNVSIYSLPEFKGDYIIGSVSKLKLLDKPFAKYISNTGKGFLYVETAVFTPLCPPNAKCTGSLQVIKKKVYVPEKLVSNKPF